jgi:hypothetical protein
MPKMVLLAAHLTLDSNDLSEWGSKFELSTEVEEKDVTTFTSLGWKELLGGLKAGQLGADFRQDFDAAALDSIMWPLLGTVVPFVVRADQASVSASNPNYTGSVLVKSWAPLTGSVGDDAKVSVTYPTSGPVLRATS